MQDVLDAADRVAAYVAQDPDLSDGKTFDAVRMQVLIVGEAVRHLPQDVLDRESDVDWAAIRGMRNVLAHEYFDTAHAEVLRAAHEGAPIAAVAVRRILDAGDLEYERSPQRTD